MKHFAQAMSQMIKTQPLKPKFNIGKVTDEGSQTGFGCVTQEDGHEVLCPHTYKNLGATVIFDIRLEGGRFERAVNLQTKKDVLSDICYYALSENKDESKVAELKEKYAILAKLDKSKIKKTDYSAQRALAYLAKNP